MATDRLIEAAQACIHGHDVVISNGGTGWQRHVEEPLWQLRKAFHRLFPTTKPQLTEER